MQLMPTDVTINYCSCTSLTLGEMMHIAPMTVPAFTPHMKTFLIIMKYLGISTKTQPMAVKLNDDAYLLVLLADQEVAAGRADQAGSLLDAAYSAFDQTMEQAYELAQAG